MNDEVHDLVQTASHAAKLAHRPGAQHRPQAWSGPSEEEIFGRALEGDVAVRSLLRPLKEHLSHAGAEELWINRPGEMLLQVGGRVVKIEDPTLTLQRLNAFAQAVAVHTNQPAFGPTHPILSATLPDGERIQVVAPPAVEPGLISVTIRIPSTRIVPLEEYKARGAFNRFTWICQAPVDPTRLDRDDLALVEALHQKDLFAFLVRAVLAHKNIGIVGDTGS
ncbi:MAG: Flp pilus assembly complex ATPase component TadA, partial [Cyanobacteria bacterium REEB65]|nr:Flp pilus assembly complex ATPase component TadA [Cyanobacteria bacterium REEB65]